MQKRETRAQKREPKRLDDVDKRTLGRSESSVRAGVRRRVIMLELSKEVWAPTGEHELHQ